MLRYAPVVGSLRDVDARHLEALVAVVDEGTFAKAASSLGFTQSAVSQQIAQLERATGLTVFDRQPGPRAVRLTRAGETVLAYARRTLAAIAEMDAELDRLRRGVTGRLLIGTFQSVSTEILTVVAGRMRRDAPDVDLVLVETDDVPELVRSVLDGGLDLAFTVDSEPDPRLEVEELGLDPFVVIAPAEEASGSIATPADLHEHPLVGQREGDACQQAIDRRLRSIGVRPDFAFRFGDNAAVQSMVRSRMGWAVVPSLAINRRDPGLRVLELEPSIEPRAIQLVRAAGRTLPIAADRFVEAARDVARGLLLAAPEPGEGTAAPVPGDGVRAVGVPAAR